MERINLQINNLNISCLDNKKKGDTLICLHGHFGTASNLAFVKDIFTGRVVIPDLRGHGLSDHATHYSVEEYVKDLEKLITALDIEHPIIFGHSLGGIIAIAYQALHQNAQMLIIEDIGTEVSGSNEFLYKFPLEFLSVYEVDYAFKEILHRPLSTYFMESLYYEENAWRFRFNYDDMIKSQKALNGNYREQWKLIKCPVLLMRGEKSWVTNKNNIEEMLKENENAILISYSNSAHSIHDDEREKFSKDFKSFIERL